MACRSVDDLLYAQVRFVGREAVNEGGGEMLRDRKRHDVDGGCDRGENMGG